ncbi:hypothetical protein F2Q69_00020428 [Brassica cretica]|uniref:Uncharacterized protein n=1 Tax=Brassica cretica TaxID=69181 RepID=A0A8S9Q153_BRACR|nr:hypothetical protein F2Q69_00020428 [Brassica cretica]
MWEKRDSGTSGEVVSEVSTSRICSKAICGCCSIRLLRLAPLIRLKGACSLQERCGVAAKEDSCRLAIFAASDRDESRVLAFSNFSRYSGTESVPCFNATRSARGSSKRPLNLPESAMM